MCVLDLIVTLGSEDHLYIPNCSLYTQVARAGRDVHSTSPTRQSIHHNLGTMLEWPALLRLDLRGTLASLLVPEAKMLVLARLLHPRELEHRTRRLLRY